MERRRDATATKAALAASARRLFAVGGYDAVGLREIAVDAGVNAALAIRYFGSKEGLFRAAVETFSLLPLLDGPREGLGARFATYLRAKGEDEDALAPLLAMLRSAGSASAMPILREVVETTFVAPLAAWLGGGRADDRARLFAATITGYSLHRYVLAPDVPLDATDLLGRQLQALVEELR